MSYQTYEKTARRAEDPRQVEYRLLGKVTRALMELQSDPSADVNERIKVLDWNRRVWSTFAADCGAKGNGLPDTLRAGIISLSIFVSKHSSAVVRGQADISVLIDINRDIMQGLAGASGEGMVERAAAS